MQQKEPETQIKTDVGVGRGWFSLLIEICPHFTSEKEAEVTQKNTHTKACAHTCTLLPLMGLKVTKAVSSGGPDPELLFLLSGLHLQPEVSAALVKVRFQRCASLLTQLFIICVCLITYSQFLLDPLISFVFPSLADLMGCE